MTRDEAVALFREQFIAAFPELTQAIDQTLGGKYLTRDALPKENQRATDRRFAQLMKELAPEMRGLDKAVRAGRMTENDARELKKEMFFEAAVQLGADDQASPAGEANEPGERAAQSAPTAPSAGNRPAVPARDPNRDAQDAAAQLLSRNQLTWGDVRAELDGYLQRHGVGMPLAEFTALVAQKATARSQAALKTQMMKEYEQRTREVRDADRAGAGKPPPGGESVDRRRELQKRFKNTGRVDDYLAAVEE